MTPPAEVQARDHFVYHVFGAKGRLLYIGCTSNLEQRQHDHRLYAQWWRPSVRWVLDGPHDYATARRLELDAIHAEDPPYNRTGRLRNYGVRCASNNRRVSA